MNYLILFIGVTIAFIVGFLRGQYLAFKLTRRVFMSMNEYNLEQREDMSRQIFNDFFRMLETNEKLWRR